MSSRRLALVSFAKNKKASLFLKPLRSVIKTRKPNIKLRVVTS